jgi:hypothetical protein
MTVQTAWLVNTRFRFDLAGTKSSAGGVSDRRAIQFMNAMLCKVQKYSTRVELTGQGRSKFYEFGSSDGARNSGAT